jgi:hypothetical protein
VAERGLRLDEPYRERPSLEDVFFDLTDDAVEYIADSPGQTA